MTDDARWMELALAQARLAAEEGEVPVGAVVVRHGQLLAVGRNANLRLQDPCAHAEIQALRAAGLASGNHRLQDCTLYVTLEPCPMCAGAMLQARLARVVYGASDPKSGAAGSVVDVFSPAALNHQTRVHSGVLADACARVLQRFFQQRRQQQRQAHVSLREDAVRTPEACFDALADYRWPARYVQHLPSLAGLRMHYLDLGPPDADHVWLGLHGLGQWSYALRDVVGPVLAAGARFVVPDLVGFGKSDKPKRPEWHSFGRHLQVLQELVEHLQLQPVSVLGLGWGGLLAWAWAPRAQERVRALHLLQCVADGAQEPVPAPATNCSLSEQHACEAPYPHRGLRAVERAPGALWPDRLDPQGHWASARQFWNAAPPGTMAWRLWPAPAAPDAAWFVQLPTSVGASGAQRPVPDRVFPA